MTKRSTIINSHSTTKPLSFVIKELVDTCQLAGGPMIHSYEEERGLTSFGGREKTVDWGTGSLESKQQVASNTPWTWQFTRRPRICALEGAKRGKVGRRHALRAPNSSHFKGQFCSPTWKGGAKLSNLKVDGCQCICCTNHSHEPHNVPKTLGGSSEVHYRASAQM